jgi:cell fate (sporulation/competence/biofilm development) regulator YmcA (YheA/YmcA/DUF963 family)
MNAYGYNSMIEERENEPVEAEQTTEARPEENIEWQKQEEEQVDAAPAVETRLEENVEWQKPATTSQPVESRQITWLSGEEINQLKSRWNSIQVDFIDEPRQSVEQADALVTEVLEQIEKMFAIQRTILNEKWTNREDIPTEDLRISLQSYRSFLNRLLAL